MSLTTAILAAGPTVVGLGVLGFRSWEQQRTFRHERGMADLTDVRKLLDEAAVALHDADYAASWVEAARTQEGPPRSPDPVIGPSGRLELPGKLATLIAMAKKMDRLDERLAVRLGPEHKAVWFFREATGALWKIHSLARKPERFIESGPEHYNSSLEAAASFQNARMAFLSTAAEEAGLRLPEREDAGRLARLLRR